jgi:hypothetical protein
MVRLISALALLKTTPKSALAALLWLLPALVGAAEATAAPAYADPVEAGQLAEPKNQETSGLAASHRTPGLLWTHNDSGGDPVLFALNANGSLRGKVRVEGVANFDWEEMATFELDGKAWLLAADMGDNYAMRRSCVLHVLAEPDATQLSTDGELVLKPEYSIHFIYEDGARDAEALAVDVKERAVYILSKRDETPRLYRLPLAAAPAAQPVAARFLGLLPHLPQPTALQRSIRLPTQGFLGWPTAMDFSHDGTLALVLIYEQPLLFPRAPGETWADALARTPIQLTPHQLPQAEAACFSPDDRAIFIGSEKTMQLLRYDRK